MLKNYLSIALRTMRRHKAHTLINVGGLAIAMAVCLLVILLAQDQRSYDRFHRNADRIVRIITDRHDRDGTAHLAASPAYVGPDLKDRVPEVEETVRLRQIRVNVILEGTPFYMEGLYAEPSFFDLFDFRLQQGDAATALDAPHQILLSEPAAERLFGPRNPIGQVVTLEGAGDFTVTGVVATRGVKTHLRFDVLASFSTLEALEWGRENLDEEVNFWHFANYVLLRPGAGPGVLDAELADMSRRYSEPRFVMKTQELTDIALGDPLSNEIATYSMPGLMILIFGLLGLIVLLAAAFNFVGLTVARSLGRAKEVGVRKTIGAERRQIVVQFLVESMLTSFCALVVATALLPFLLPAFNGLSEIQELEIELSAASTYQPAVILLFVIFSLFVGVLSGLYPALYLSGFRPARVMKGLIDSRSAGSLLLRKGLVVAQFTLSLVFVASVAVLYRQYDHMRHADYGFSDVGLINVPLKGNDYGLLREEWLRHNGVLEVSATHEPPATGSTMGIDVVTASGDTIPAVGYSIDPSFVDNMGLRLLAGRTVTPGQPGVVVNETMLRALDLKTPGEAVGALIDVGRFPEPQPIAGVVQDYWFTHAVMPIQPLVLFHDPALFRWAVVRLHPETRSEAMAHLQSVWKRVDAVHPLEHRSFDEIRNSNATQAIRDVARIVGFLSTIALMIACLGLLSMAALRAQTRTKEVGIRKVLGAQVPGLVLLLSSEFLKMLALAVVLAAPIAWYLNHAWLNAFAYRISFGAETLILAMGGVLLIALLTVGSQAFRAAATDPVRSLRYE